MGQLFVLGSLNMDISIEMDQMPKVGETLHGYDFMLNTGGKGGNQAVAAAKSGSDVYMIACVGEDAYGHQLVEDLMHVAVHIPYVAYSKNHATGCAIILRSKGDNRIVLNSGANYDIKMSQVSTCLDRTAKPNDIFLTQLECQYSLVQQSLQYAKQLGLYTILNPAPAQILSSDVYNTVDLIIVNETECECLTNIFPSDYTHSVHALNYFKENGCDAIITLGANGSIALIQGEVYVVNACNVAVVDTTAAGDTYIGALCHALLQKESIIDALRFASAASALSVTRKGAQKTIPDKIEIMNFLHDYALEIL